MASFRTGFKIIGELSLKQGLGRIRSFSEDKRRPQWLPEDQWAVRHPTSTCPDLCAKKKKPQKASKSWLSLCKDPDAPKDPECDIRHNNCPPPPVKDTSPWYSLGKFIPKKKPAEKPPPLQSCCEERRRRELADEEEEVCCFEDVAEPPELPEPPCIPKKVRPAPVVTLSCPVPKELNLALWCDCTPGTSNKISSKCESDRLPYDEFKPQKMWKPPPFSLPTKFEPTFTFPPCSTSCIPYSEYKYIDVPKPLYTRYKSVELGDSHTLFSMTNVQCKEDGTFTLGTQSNLPPPPPPLPLNPEPTEKDKVPTCPEKRVLEAGSRKPVKLKNATKFCFTPKPTKLVERRVYKDRFGNKKCDLPFRAPAAKDGNESTNLEQPTLPYSKKESAKGTPAVKSNPQRQEPNVYEGLSVRCKPPSWMYVLCKPGSKTCPLLPCAKDCTPPESEDWSSELEAFGKNEKLVLKPPVIPACPKNHPVSAVPPAPPPPPATPPSPATPATPAASATPGKSESLITSATSATPESTAKPAPSEKSAPPAKSESSPTSTCSGSPASSAPSAPPVISASTSPSAPATTSTSPAPSAPPAPSALPDTSAPPAKSATPASSASPSPPKPKNETKPAKPDCDKSKLRFVLMPAKYNIKLMRPKDAVKEEKEVSVEKIIQEKSTPTKKCPNSLQPMKENIYYDLQRICPEPPFDPTKLNTTCRKIPNPPCPQPPKFYRSLSTLAPSALRKLCSVELCKTPRRTECGDSSGKCKAKDLTPKSPPCPEPCPPPDCADIALPCCPKARVPPNCNVKRPLPCCRKKLAPKPSFSECSKDPPPCPRPTECNCWEKGPNKKR